MPSATPAAWGPTLTAAALRVLLALACVGLAAGPAAAAPTPGTPTPAAAVPTGLVKYYVVGVPVGGRREYLFAIAARYLGNGNRAGEIFALNAGRVQPDREALTDPAVLNPGWVLLLPRDASGPGVRVGHLPTPPATTVAAVPAAATPDQDIPIRTVVLATVAGALVLSIVALRRGTRLRLSPVGRRRDPPATGFDPYGELLEARVATGRDRATVRLAGARSARTGSAWWWLAPDGAAPRSSTSVAVGTGRDGTLCLDLVRAPDVLTLTGDGPAGRRLAAVLARQLVARGIAVTAVGTVLGTDVLDQIKMPGVHVVPSLVDTEAVGADQGMPRVLFCPPPAPGDLPVVRRLNARSAPRVVVVLVGDARPGRWSIEARPAS